jgi:hypothetical protein
MSMMRPLVWLTVLTAAFAFAAPASAQFYQPFVDPHYLGTPDLQFFAPAEVGEFSGPEPANTGPYFVYERLYLNMTRPEGEASLFSDTNGDWTWGNRWELGYMTEEKTGWQTVVWNLNGPNVGFVNAQHQNFVEDPQLSVFDQFAIDSLNIATMSSFELNKMWRRKEFHDHSVLDLLLGFRMIQYNDYYRREVTTKGEVAPPDPDLWAIVYNNQLAQFENMMYGGQFGGRWFNQRGHWLLSVEARMFALANNQMFTQTTEFISVDADVTDGDNIRLIGVPEIQRSQTNAHRAQFCWGGEVRVEAAYELTRDISLRVGGMFCDLGQGVGRGNLINLNDQDVQIAGVTFGVTINR